MKIGFLVFFLFLISEVTAKDLKEVLSTETISFAVRRDLSKTQMSQREIFQAEIIKEFVSYLNKKYKKNIQSNIVIVPSLKDFWEKTEGVFEEGKTYTPYLFSKVDVYADNSYASAWRKKLAYPIPYLQVNDMITCNFISQKRLTTRDIFETNIQMAIYHANPVEEYHDKNIIKSNLNVVFFKKRDELFNYIQKQPKTKKICTIIPSDYGVYFFSMQDFLFFNGFLDQENQDVAWWTSSKNELSKELTMFFNDFTLSPAWNSLFMRAHIPPYNIYRAFIGTF